jgi:arsenate reductase
MVIPGGCGPHNGGVTDLILWTNPSCSKSRTAEDLLAGRGATRRYLDEPPTRAELEDLLVKLGTDDPRVITRPGVLPDADRDELLDALSADAELIERPIAIRGDRAVVARPPERLLELL